MPRQKPEPKRTYSRPLSLSSMTFEQAVNKIVRAKPTKNQKTPKTGHAPKTTR